jgi:acyl transferase domain-containing protein
VFTANDAESVQEGADNCQQYIEKHPIALEDIAYTLGARREHLPYRSFTVTDNRMLPRFSAPAKVPKVRPEVIFVFTGQGAQWATMGTILMSDFPTALRDLELMDEALSRLPEPPTWTFKGETPGQLLHLISTRP